MASRILIEYKYFFNQIDFAQAGIITPVQTEPESHGNEGVLQTSQISETGASPSDSV